MTKLLVATGLFIALSGCAAPPTPTPSHLMALPLSDVFEEKSVANVPVATAYRNTLEYARRCWRGTGVIEPSPYDAEVGVARVSYRLGAFIDGVKPLLINIDLKPVGNITAFLGRTYGQTLATYISDSQAIAEGRKATCSERTP